MTIERDTITLPAAWASALINGDYSGFDYSNEYEDDAARCAATEQNLADQGWSIVSCNDEPRFTCNYRLYDPYADCVGGEVLDYTILRAVADLKL